MALQKYLKPPKSMILDHSEEYREEGLTPGLRFIQTGDPTRNILLNATYNNYTITNHYRSREQIKANKRLKKTQKTVDEAYHRLAKKYKASKKLLNRAMPLLSFVDIDRLDEESRESIIDLNQKWEAVSDYRNKRKMVVEEEAVDEEEQQTSFKKHKSA